MDKYFLASNSKDGFYSKFSELTTYSEIKDFYIIKAGAGCGKSTFMKKLGNYLIDNGYDAEFIYCSSDPNSLDGVISKKGKLAICDGTAPHTTEPKYTGAFDHYLDFSCYLDKSLLKPQFAEIRSLTDTISAKYKSAYKFLNCAGILDNELFSMGVSTDAISKIKKRTQGIISREIPTCIGEKKVYDRFLTGISPKGVVNFKETILDKAKKVYLINDSFGMSHFLMCELLNNLTGYTVYKFLSPLNPLKIEHLYIEELGLAFITKNSIDLDTEVFRNINLDTYIEYDKKRVKKLNKQIELNINEAVEIMSTCKSLHDDLEAIYIKAMDYSKLDDLFNNIISEIK